MPTYEYECDSCNFRFEKRQGFHDEPVVLCPRCEGLIHRVFHPSPIIFKGSGFYITDSRAKNSASDDIKSDKAEKESPEKMPDKSEGKEPKGE